jgi:hypothetical protein
MIGLVGAAARSYRGPSRARLHQAAACQTVADGPAHPVAGLAGSNALLNRDLACTTPHASTVSGCRTTTTNCAINGWVGWAAVRS